MTSILYLCAVSAAIIIAVLLFRKGSSKNSHWLFPFLSFVLPFAAGGFHTYVAAVCAGMLLWALIHRVRKNGTFRFYWNLPSLAVLLLTVGYCVSPLWAADRGMSVFGIPRYLPLMLYMLYLMQCGQEETEALFSWIPLCGAVMTVAALAASLIPALKVYVTVNGRLAGFFQYPNTFALFLLAGLIISAMQKQSAKADALVSGLLILGIVLSGSKTVLVLLAAALAVLIFLRRDIPSGLRLICSGCIALALALLFAQWGLLENAGRFTSISTSSGTFLVRLLYYKDAFPVILRHPFGTGYLGYAALEGSIQTGRYYVRFVHNGFLQILLDIGWIPGLLLAAAFLWALLSGRTTHTRRLLLIFCLAHCLMDFDLQFLSIWILLLSCLDFQEGACRCLSFGKGTLCLSGALLLVCLWLGSGELLHALNRTNACLTVTPFHTDALSARLTLCKDTEQADLIAGNILELAPTHALAASSKANSAFSQGDILAMAKYKELAIHNSRYTTAEYCDYFDKLYYAFQQYLQVGDYSSAEYCRQKLLQIPKMMEEVSDSTDPLAYLTGDDSSLQLPQQYTEVLNVLVQ